MSNRSEQQKAKKFQGFTNIFRKANAQEGKKDAVKTEEIKKPFRGFTEAYKNFQLKEPEYEDDIDSYESYIIRPRREVVEVQPAEPIKHFVPMKYNLWRKERIATAEERLGISQKGDESQDEAGDPLPSDSRKGRSFASESLENRSRQYVYLHQAPQYFNEYPSTAPQLDYYVDVFKSKPDIPESFSNLNEYPQRYHMQMLNYRLKKFLRPTHDDSIGDFGTVTRSNYSDIPIDYKSYTANKKELIEYFDKNVESSGNRKIDFDRESFKDWYSKFSFNFEKKFKNIPKFEFHNQDDFQSWYEQLSEKVNRHCDLTNEKLVRMDLANVWGGSELGWSIGGKNPSISRCNTCRSI